MARRLFTLLSALSLLLCVAVGVLWIWSYTAASHLLWKDEAGRVLGATDGELWVGDPLTYQGPAGEALAGFGTSWDMSLALPFLLLVILPAIWGTRTFFERKARARSLSVGLCRQCRYDLRATPGRCPECGAVCPGTAEGTRPPP